MEEVIIVANAMKRLRAEKVELASALVRTFSVNGFYGDLVAFQIDKQHSRHFPTPVEVRGSHTVRQAGWSSGSTYSMRIICYYNHSVHSAALVAASLRWSGPPLLIGSKESPWTEVPTHRHKSSLHTRPATKRCSHLAVEPAFPLRCVFSF